MSGHNIHDSEVSVTIDDGRAKMTELVCSYANYQAVDVEGPISLSMLSGGESMSIIVSRRQLLRWLNLVREMV